MVTGGPVPVQQGIQQAATNSSGAAQAAWSDSGSMAFVPGGATALERDLVWLNRQGLQERTTAPRRNFWGLTLSPDGTQAAVVVANTVGVAGTDIWVWTIARGALTRLTFTGAAVSPVWTRDGRRICYSGTVEAFCQAADGSGQPLSLFKFPGSTELGSISPDGVRLVFTVSAQTAVAERDILVATLGSPIEIRPLIKTALGESSPRISPDGRWIAYASDESGRTEVYVRPFPEVDQGRWQVSTDGGVDPRWAKNGRELFFAKGGFGTPRSFWSTQVHVAATRGTGAEASRPHLVVVQNWFDELKARVPTTPRRD